jgi:C1A family cysteine protease
MSAYKLTWCPDSTCPIALPARQQLSSPLGQASLKAVPTKIVEANGVLDLRPLCPPIDNQGQVSDCVADGTTTALEMVEIIAGRPFVKKSRLFVYYNARLQTQDTDKDMGTYIHLAFTSLTTLGTCTEQTWTYDPSAVFTRPSWTAYQEAYAHKIATFYNIDATNVDLISGVKQALQANCPVVFGMTVDQAFQNVGADGIVPAFNPSVAVNPGGHCTVLVGYDDNQQRFIGKNSWGTSWGLGGYYLMGYSDLAARGANDFWVPTASK